MEEFKNTDKPIEQRHSYLENPWKGLNFYREGDILYGRADEIKSLSLHIVNNTQTVLYGKSGIGKSSIINAGIFPIARKAGLYPVPIRLEHNLDISYISQIKEAFKKSGIGIREVVQPIKEEEESLWEFLHRNAFNDPQREGAEVRPLIVFDQFEEIFTLQYDEKRKRDFFNELADLINDVMPQYILDGKGNEKSGDSIIAKDGGPGSGFTLDFGSKDSSSRDYIEESKFNLVFTIREDFLSYLERYTAYIPAMKLNRYDLQTINEEQAKEIIMRPRPGLVDEDVAFLIVQKVTGATGFKFNGIPEIEVDAAVLSLYLSRLYTKRRNADDKITANLVNLFGDDIIKDYYEESVTGLEDSKVEYLEDKLVNNDGRRENISVYNAKTEGHLSDEDILRLTNVEKLLRCFSYCGSMKLEYIHDILCPVIKKRKEDRFFKQQQEKERFQQEEEKRQLLEEEKRKRTEIEAAAKAEREKMAKEARRVRNRNRRRLYIISSFVLFLLISIFSYFWLYEFEHISYYARFDRVSGWPTGVGDELSSSERAVTPLYYKLTHKGYLSHETDVEVCSSNERLPLYPRIKVFNQTEMDNNDRKGTAYKEMLSQVKKIHFVEGEENKIDREVVMGENDSVLFVMNYFHLSNGKEAWIHFITSAGQPIQISDNGVDRMRVSWDNKGRIVSTMFFDILGVCLPVGKNVCGYKVAYSEDGSRVSHYLLDEFGRTLQSDYNVEICSQRKDTLETVYAKAMNVNDFSPVLSPGPEGYSRMIKVRNTLSLYVPGKSGPVASRLLKCDGHGNVVQETTKGERPRPYPTTINYSYVGNTGYMACVEKLDAKGKPFSQCRDGIYKTNWRYGKNGRLVLEEKYAPSRKRIYMHQITEDNGVTVDILENLSAVPSYVETVDTVKNGYKSITYYSRGKTPLNRNVRDGNITLSCHKMVVRGDKKEKKTSYYTFNENRQLIPLPLIIDEYGVAVSYSNKEEVFDEDGNRLSYRLFDSQNNIIKSMMYFYQSGQAIARAAMGVDGTPVRCPEWEEEGFAYYKLYYSKDFQNSYVHIKAVNEWDGNSLFYDPSSKSYKSISYQDYHDCKIVCGNQDVKINKSYKQFYLDLARDVSEVSLPYLHIQDKRSPLYVLGLKDGDRIIALGSWKQGGDGSLLMNQWMKMAGGEGMIVEVLRPVANFSFKSIKKTVRLKDRKVMADYKVYRLSNEEEQILSHYKKQ